MIASVQILTKQYVTRWNLAIVQHIVDVFEEGFDDDLCIVEQDGSLLLILTTVFFNFVCSVFKKQQCQVQNLGRLIHLRQLKLKKLELKNLST